MKTAELIHQKIDDLPESAYSTLLDYVEFLLQKYRSKDTQEEERERLTQELLMKRYEAYQRDPANSGRPFADFDTEIRQKHGWNG